MSKKVRKPRSAMINDGVSIEISSDNTDAVMMFDNGQGFYFDLKRMKSALLKIEKCIQYLEAREK